MQNQRGFIGVGLLIAIVLGLVVVGSGAYFVMQQNAPSQTATDIENFDNLPQLPTNNYQNQPTKNTPTTGSGPANLPTASLKTYANSKFGYSVQYPSSWVVGPDKPIVDAVNKIRSAVTLYPTDESRHLSILVNEKEWLIKMETLFTQEVTVAGAKYTAYIFPEGYECHMADPDRKDCSFFVVPIFRDGVWYELHAQGDARAITSEWSKILSSFKFTNVSPGEGASNGKASIPTGAPVPSQKIVSCDDVVKYGVKVYQDGWEKTFKNENRLSDAEFNTYITFNEVNLRPEGGSCEVNIYYTVKKDWFIEQRNDDLGKSIAISPSNPPIQSSSTRGFGVARLNLHDSLSFKSDADALAYFLNLHHLGNVGGTIVQKGFGFAEIGGTSLQGFEASIVVAGTFKDKENECYRGTLGLVTKKTTYNKGPCWYY